MYTGQGLIGTLHFKLDHQWLTYVPYNPKKKTLQFALAVRATKIRFNLNGQPMPKQRNDRFQINATFCAHTSIIYLPPKTLRYPTCFQKLGAAPSTWNSLSAIIILLVYVGHSRCHVQESFGSGIAQSSKPVMYTSVECHKWTTSIFVAS